MKTGTQLIQLAEMCIDDSIANLAMDELRKRFDSSYRWREECNEGVVKQSECCMNNISKKDDFEVNVDDW